MRHVAIAGCATLAFLGVICQPALAHQNSHESPFVKLHNNVSLSGGATYQHYEEYIYNRLFNGLFDKETGWVPNINASASYMTPKNHYWFNVNVRYSWGNMTHNQPGSKSTTGNQIVNVNGKVGRGFRASNRFMVTPFLTYGHRYWHRHLGIKSPGGYKENYNMNYLGAGAMLDFRATQRLMLSAQGMVGGTFDNTMTNTSNPVNYGLGSEPIAKTSLKADYHLRGHWHVFGKVNYTYFQFGSSKFYPVQYGSTREPTSTTQDVSMDVGIRYTFESVGL